VPTYVSLLRGINVGGRRKVAMSDLRALYAALGHAEVTTYVQSGNVVSACEVADPDEVAAAAEAGIAAELGLDVRVLVRTPAALATVVARNPFLPSGADPARLSVCFLAETPGPERVRDLVVPDSGADEFHVEGREVYLHLPNGMARTKLGNDLWERRLGVAATNRNWKTVTTLLEMAGG